MFIRKVQLDNFKRFTSLTIDLSNLTQAPKLVLLIGANGSGKSSVFDAFEWSSSRQKDGTEQPLIYYKKRMNDLQAHVRIDFWKGESLTKANLIKENQISPKLFYGRSSLRQVPRLTRTFLGQNDFSFNKNITDSDRPRQYIDRDERFENDLEVITGQILQDVFKSDIQTSQIKESYIKPINDAFLRIFNNNSATSLKLTQLNPPLEGNVANILFQKGNSEIHYDLLSSGEKEVFNILINLLSRRNMYQDTIYFFDEIDLHLNTTLQYNLLKEITEHWIPDNCQLWTASHSLGFIDYANDSEQAAIIDLDDLNFDQPQVLYPKPKNRLDIFEIAIPRETLAKILKGKKIIICENRNDELYNLLGLDEVVFVGVKNSREVFINIKRNPAYFGLRDRDFLTDNEIVKIKSSFPNYHILQYYTFENYVYHPDNIEELKKSEFDRQAYVHDIINQKNKKLTSILIDIKSSRNTYEELKDERLKDKNIDNITDALQSNEFEKFYAFFNMKDEYDKKYLERLNIPVKELVQTSWFRKQIQQILAN